MGVLGEGNSVRRRNAATSGEAAVRTVYQTYSKVTSLFLSSIYIGQKELHVDLNTM